MSFVKQSCGELMVDVVFSFLVEEISLALPERFMKSMENHCLWCFKKMCQLLLKETLVFILDGLLPATYTLVVDKLLRNILLRFRKKKMFPNPPVVVVV